MDLAKRGHWRFWREQFRHSNIDVDLIGVGLRETVRKGIRFSLRIKEMETQGGGRGGVNRR